MRSVLLAALAAIGDVRSHDDVDVLVLARRDESLAFWTRDDLPMYRRKQ